MSREPIPDEVKRFILTSVPSVPFLEAMLLFRNSGEKTWNSSGIARRIYLSDKASLEVVQELSAAGIISPVDEDKRFFKYAPANEALQEMIDQLAQYYSKNLIEVTDLIHSKTNKRAQQFADAFIWRKDS